MKWIFVVWVLIKSFTMVYLKLMNLHYSRRVEASIPEVLKDVISIESHEKSRRYLADNTRADLIQELTHAGVLVALVLMLAPWLERWVLDVTGSFLLQGLIFFAALFLVDYVLSLPFKIYDTFVLEQSYGFNRTSCKTFLLDEIKGLLLGGVLGGLLLLGVLYVIQFPLWWWRFAVVIFPFILLIQWIAPVWIMPLFYKLSPLPEGELKTKIDDFALRLGIPIKQIVVIDASTRSSKGNAAFAGLGATQRLILFDTILHYPHDEILSVVAHEWGHRKHHHIIKQMAFSLGITLLVLILANFLTLSSIPADGFGLSTLYGQFYLAVTLVGPLMFFIEPLTSQWSRKHEFEADRYAVLALRKPEATVQSLKRLLRDNLSNINPHPMYSAWFYSHPSPVERIAAISAQKVMEAQS
jgi:STE24 endopeptidase